MTEFNCEDCDSERDDKAPPKTEAAAVGQNYEELKSQIATLTETVKKDEEKINTFTRELEEWKPAERYNKSQRIALIVVLILFTGIIGIALSIYLVKSKKNGFSSLQDSSEKIRLSAELASAKQEAEQHKAELETKQRELERYLLGL